VFGKSAPLSPLILVFSLVLIGISILKFNKKTFSLPLLLLILFYFSYLYIGIISYINNPELKHPRTSNIELIRSYHTSIIIIVAFYLGAINAVQKSGEFKLIRRIFFLSLIPAFIITFAAQFDLKSFYNFASTVTLNSDRESGLFGDPNEAGLFGLYFLVIILSLINIAKKYWVFLIGLIPLAYYIIFSSFSRASIIMSFVVLICFILYNFKFIGRLDRSNSLKLATFIAVFITLIVVGISKYNNFIDNLSHGQKTRLLQTVQIFEGKINKKTTSYRSFLYAYSWDKIKSRPAFGYGLGSFHRIKALPKPMGTHNTHLLIWAESGIFPLLLFCLAYAIIGYLGLINPNAGIGFLTFGIVLIYFFNFAGTLHNALDDRISNALIGIVLALAQFRGNPVDSNMKNLKQMN
jgi:O-antigen ligase